MVDDFRQPGNRTRLIVNYGGDWNLVHVNGTFSFGSSRTIKDAIRPLPGDVAKTIVSALEPVSFHFKKDASKTECLGFIAEDTPPEVATPDRDGIVVNHIVAALTRVVKDQQELVEALQGRLSRLEKMGESHE